MLGNDAVTALAKRLNRSGRDRLGAMWEVVVLHSLSEHGMLQNEAPLGSGRRPDVAFANSNLSFTADITTISDEGLDERNPHRELTGLMMKVKARLGLKGAGMDIRIRARSEQTSGGSRTVLLLPEHRYLQTMIKEKILRKRWRNRVPPYIRDFYLNELCCKGRGI